MSSRWGGGGGGGRGKGSSPKENLLDIPYLIKETGGRGSKNKGMTSKVTSNTLSGSGSGTDMTIQSISGFQI